jgi:hypothetical protein
MRVVQEGHIYLLDHIESAGHERLTFLRRSSAAIDYGLGQHPGTNSQEAMRALINRAEYLNRVLPSVETLDAAWYMRMALFCFEARAWRRKQQGQNKGSEVNDYVERYKDVPFNEQGIELRPVAHDGHIILV